MDRLDNLRSSDIVVKDRGRELKLAGQLHSGSVAHSFFISFNGNAPPPPAFTYYLPPFRYLQGRSCASSVLGSEVEEASQG